MLHMRGITRICQGVSRKWTKLAADTLASPGGDSNIKRMGVLVVPFRG